MERKQCQICFDHKLIRKDISRCPNAECNAFTCKTCLDQWYLEKKECPICHTRIGDLEENLQVVVEEVEEVDEGSEEDICHCTSIYRLYRCYHNPYSQDLYSSTSYFMKSTLIFMITGFITFNISACLKYESLSKTYDNTKENYTDPGFYMILISLGMVTIGSVLICIGICVGCLKCGE